MPFTRKKRTNSSVNARSSKIRIIGGLWRGRKLPVTEANGLRPTGDRMRETLFNWLTPDLPQARCLDLFAGTGALGLEALSRGALAVDFVEIHRDAYQQLNENLKLLNTSDATTINGSAMLYISQDHQPYNIIFLDPPFDENLWQECIDIIEQRQLVAEDGLIYVEHPRDRVLKIPSQWQILKQKQHGQVTAMLYQRPMNKG